MDERTFKTLDFEALVSLLADSARAQARDGARPFD